MDKKELILVCGISGAGKSVTMNYLESAGFYCVDNLPLSALRATLDALDSDKKYYRYAIAINSNVNQDTISKNINLLKSYEKIDVKILFLDTIDDVLYKRFQMTRKSHPFIYDDESLVDAITRERELLNIIKQHATVIVDTTNFSEEKLKNYLKKLFDHEIIPKFRVSFMSFGFKNGCPQNTDYLFDVRFIDNPYYDEKLRYLSGEDKEVSDYVLNQEPTKEFLDKATSLLDLCLKEQQKTNRSYLVIAIGCTGGQHRSVAITDYLANHYDEKYIVIKEHRDAKL